LPEVPITVVAWLAQVGGRVFEGDRLVELLVGEVLLELDSPATGILLEQCVPEHGVVQAGQVLGVVRER